MRRNNSMEMGLVTPSRYRSASFSLANGGGGGHYPVQQVGRDRTVEWRDDQCLSRVPYASMMAFLLCFIGVVLFSTMMIWSFNASVEQTRRALNITDIPWLDKVQIAFVIVAIVMATVALLLLIFGILGTGSTREAVYKEETARRGGRLSCMVGATVAYLLNVVWMLVLSITAILAFIYYIFSQLCYSLTVYTEDSCLDFSVFRPFVSSISDSKLILCGGSAQQFCALTSTVAVWYLVGFVGSFLICLGLVQFIATNTANYSNIKNEKKNSELQDVLLAEINGQQTGYSSRLVPEAAGQTNMDFHVDYHPMSHHATLPLKTYPLPPSLTPQQQFHLESQAAGQQARNGMVGHTINQTSAAPLRGVHDTSGVGRMRRNSYHNLFNENNGWTNTLY